LKLIVGKVPADDAFVVQLACEALHAVIKNRGVVKQGRGWFVLKQVRDQGCEWNWRTCICAEVAEGEWLTVEDVDRVSVDLLLREEEATSRC